jgi:hypothetical protein
VKAARVGDASPLKTGGLRRLGAPTGLREIRFVRANFLSRVSDSTQRRRDPQRNPVEFLGGSAPSRRSVARRGPVREGGSRAGRESVENRRVAPLGGADRAPRNSFRSRKFSLAGFGFNAETPRSAGKPGEFLGGSARFEDPQGLVARCFFSFQRPSGAQAFARRRLPETMLTAADTGRRSAYVQGVAKTGNSRRGGL